MSDMNVGSVSGVYSAISTSTPVVSDSAASAAQTPAANTADVAAVYEKSEGAANKATYSINKMSAEDRAALVQQLKQDQVDRQNQMVDLVRKMFSIRENMLGITSK